MSLRGLGQLEGPRPAKGSLDQLEWGLDLLEGPGTTEGLQEEIFAAKDAKI